MKRREAGFTLLEMLVALIVFGMLMAGLSQTMRYGLRAWTAETSGAGSSEALAAVDAAIRRLIEQAQPDRFVGEPNSLAFTSVLPEGAGLTDPRADMALRVDAGGRLVLRWTPHPPGLPLGSPPAPHEETLLDGVRAIRVSYLVAHAKGPPVWVGSWNGHGPPLLVRIGITFAGRASWPDLVAAPVAGSDTEG